MEKVKYNQFQSWYQLKNDKVAVVDFLHNEIKVIEQSCEPEYEFDSEYDSLANRLDKILTKKRNDILNITLITSLECNMCCVYCYEKSVSSSFEKVDDKLDLERMVDFVKDEYTRGDYSSINANILGGEPLLDINIGKIDVFIKNISQISPKAHFSIVTNGINVTKYIDQLVKWKIENVQVTMDGTELIHNSRRIVSESNINSFYTIVEGIDALCDKGISVFLRTNVDQNNISDINSFSRFIIDKGWLEKGVTSYIYPVTTSGCSDYILEDSELDIFKKILKELGKNPELNHVFDLDFHGIKYINDILNGIQPTIKTRFCGVSQGQYVLSPEGNVLNCWWGLEEKIFKVGEIRTDGYSIDYKKIDMFHERSVLTTPNCISCKFKYFCGGGCAYKEHAGSGTVNNGQCYPYDELIKEYLNYAISE